MGCVRLSSGAFSAKDGSVGWNPTPALLRPNYQYQGKTVESVPLTWTVGKSVTGTFRSSLLTRTNSTVTGTALVALSRQSKLRRKAVAEKGIAPRDREHRLAFPVVAIEEHCNYPDASKLN